MRVIIFLLIRVLICRALIQSGYYCNDPSTLLKNYYVVGCCHDMSYIDAAAFCQNDLYQTINGVTIYPTPQLPLYPCSTPAQVQNSLKFLGISGFECDLFSVDAFTYVVHDSNADVIFPYEQDFYFCQPADTCLNIQPCPPCLSTQYRAGCGIFPTNVPVDTPVSLASLLQEEVGSCQPCAGCLPGQQYNGCNADGTAQCSECGPSYSSGGGYNQCELCKTCPAGNGLVQCNAIGVGVCEACNTATYPDSYSYGNTPCLACPSGSYSIATTCICYGAYYAFDGVSCELCKPGYYYTLSSAPNGMITLQTCTICSINHYCAGGPHGPTACTPGTTCPYTGMSQPYPCKAGFFCPATGIISACWDGYYCPSGSSTITPCPTNTWGNSTGQALEVLACSYTCGLTPGCQPGQYTTSCLLNFQGICQNCQSCSAGQYQIGCSGTGITDDSSCQACAADTYSADASVRQCTACPTGATSSAGSSGCTCNAGYAQTSETSCAACQPNSYSSAGATSCPCNSGFLRQTSLPGSSCTCIGFICNCIPVPSAVTCVPCASCPAAQYRQGCQGVNVGTCVACGSCSNATIFQNCAGTGTTDDHVCTPCPAGLHNTGGYATACTNCSACPAGAYAACDGTTRCVPCAQCNAGKIGFI